MGRLNYLFMASVNRVTLVGNLGANPEVRRFDGGTLAVTISIATSEKYKNRNNEVIEDTEWHRVEFWGATAEVAEKHLKKGDSVYVEGKIKTEKWKDKEGIERWSTKIRANVLQMLGKREAGQSAATTGGPSATPPIGSTEDGDLPF